MAIVFYLHFEMFTYRSLNSWLVPSRLSQISGRERERVETTFADKKQISNKQISCGQFSWSIRKSKTKHEVHTTQSFFDNNVINKCTWFLSQPQYYWTTLHFTQSSDKQFTSFKKRKAQIEYCLRFLAVSLKSHAVWCRWITLK